MQTTQKWVLINSALVWLLIKWSHHQPVSLAQRLRNTIKHTVQQHVADCLQVMAPQFLYGINELVKL